MGGAVGGCVVLLALVALTISVVAVLFKYLKLKSYFGVERNNTVAYNNSIYGCEGGKVILNKVVFIYKAHLSEKYVVCHI